MGVLRVVPIALVAVLLGLFGWRLIAESDGRNLAREVRAGKAPAAPDFELPLIGSDGALRLSALRGKAVVVNFWASWCRPCDDEAPRLEEAWRAHRGRGLVMVGVDGQDFDSDARAFIRRHGLSYPNVDDDGATLRRYGVSGFPETWFVDRSGRLVGEQVDGPVSRAQLARNVELALR